MTWVVMFVGPVSAGQIRPNPRAFDSIDEFRGRPQPGRRFARLRRSQDRVGAMMGQAAS